ncbi:MAG: hypothetical protein HYY37_04635 [Candidatus Aenigmarchaeota archaeon]|nr:hypothetical protein [Candidatus Aenigmarchaeota archaeon]
MKLYAFPCMGRALPDGTQLACPGDMYWLSKMRSGAEGTSDEFYRGAQIREIGRWNDITDTGSHTVCPACFAYYQQRAEGKL